MWQSALVFAATSQHTHVVCDTTVNVGDGRIVIELWPHAAPLGVQRLTELVHDHFMDGLPMFRALPNFLVQFGIQPDAELQAKWKQRGAIQDDPPSSIPFTEGVVSFAGAMNRGDGAGSRGTQLFMTLGNQPGLGKAKWEVPVGKVVRGVEVLRGVYTGYGGQVSQSRLRGPGGTEYLETSFPLLSYFRSCNVSSHGADDKDELRRRRG